MDITLDQLLPLLRQTFGSHVELATHQIVKLRHDYLVLLCQLRHPSLQVVIKLAGPEAALACPFERTAALHRLVAARTAIPVPGVLAADTSCRAWPWRILIKTHIPGQEWAGARGLMSPAEQAGAHRQMGEAVAQLHTIGFPGFGELADDGGVQGDGPYLAALAEHARSIIQSARLRDLFLSLLERERDRFLGVREASLCHEDLHQHNVLFDYRAGRWHLAAILDYEKAWAGHHESDLARLDLWPGMTSGEFWRAYQAIRRVEPLYEVRRPIYQLLWCLEVAWPTPDHLALTQSLCAELGLPRLEGFA